MKQQKGFAHAFLVVGLVLVLIGALGFIYWQNFIHKEPVTTQDTSHKTLMKKPESPKKTQIDYVRLSDWGIKIPVSTQDLGTSVITNKLTSSGTIAGFDSHTYVLKTNRVQSIGATCESNAYGLISLSRTLDTRSQLQEVAKHVEPSDFGNYISHIGKWYYYVSDHENCSSTDVSTQNSDRESLTKLVKNLQAE